MLEQVLGIGIHVKVEDGTCGQGNGMWCNW